MSAQPLQTEDLGDFETTPGIEARMSALARTAKIDPDSRNALYWALSYKIERFVRRYRYRERRSNSYDFADIAQEAFLVFCDMVERWPGQQSFLGYFFSRFPWRLARAVQQLDRGSGALPWPPLIETGEPYYEYQPQDFGLAEFAARLRPRDRIVLELHIVYGLRFNEIARLLKVHPRTISRSWARIAAEVRSVWTEHEGQRA